MPSNEPSRKSTLLIVDDQQVNIQSLANLLKEEYHILVATSGAKALDIATGKNPPDLILLDIQMPEMDGYEVCCRLKAEPQTCSIPVIFVTVRNAPEDEEKGLSLGAVDYISKPFQPQIVRARVKNQTDRRRAEEAIQQVNERLSLATRAGGVGCWDLDIVNNVLTWDKQMFSLYGIKKDLLAEANDVWQAGVFPEDRMRVDEEILKAIRGETEFNTGFRVLWPEGSIHNIRALALVQRDASGDPVRMIGTNWDITEIKQTEQTLKENEEKFISIFEETPDPILILNQTCQIIEVNHGFERLFGYAHTDVSGKGLEELGLGLTGSRIDRMLERTEPTGHISHEEMTLVHRTGVPFIADVALSRIMIKSKPCLLVQIHDIDEIRRAHEAVAQANKKLNILSSITRHDILNKVMVISINSEEVRNTVNDPKLIKDLDAVIRSSADIQNLIQFTQHYQDLGTTKPAWQEVELLLKRRSIQGLLTGINLLSDLGSILIYSDQMLEKVLYNLVENSVRHGEHLTTIQLSCHEKDRGLIIWYEDDGGGIINAEKEKAFKKGFGKNTGMGLFLIREILSITGITIQEIGEPGVGVRFEISVPAGTFRRSGRE